MLSNVNNQIVQFKSQASQPQHAIALIFDLEGFSRFFSQPDAQLYVPRFLNRVFEAIYIVINGGKEYWISKSEERSGFLKPAHTKFMGDGALFVWTFSDDFETVRKNELVYFLNGLWNLRSYFDSLVRIAADDVPVVDLPRKIRFGMAAGSVYQLTYASTSRTEYIGYCINLASRLQSYCRELGFIASARIGLQDKIVKKHEYMKVIAKKLKGFPREIVIVDKSEYNDLDEDVRNELFESI